MTTKRKSFDITPAATNNEPLPFDLTWTGTDGKKGKAEFEAHPDRIPVALVMKVPNMRVDGDSVAMFKVFEHALGGKEADDYQRFEEIILDPDKMVSAPVLAEIIAWLAEEATGRPTEQSAP